jgi:Domain of unknown function (DUF4279)
MQNRYRIDIDYCIEGFAFDPDEITQRTGIKPSKVARAGEPVPWASKIKSETIPKIKFSRWELQSNLDSSVDVEEQIRVLIQRLQPAWSEFVNLGKEYDGIFTCVIWDYSDARPAIYFDKDIIKFAAELNALIQVSVYSMSREQESQ